MQSKLLGFQGLKRFELAEALAGDIVAVTGMSELNVGETITSIAEPTILPLLKIDAPTISMHRRRKPRGGSRSSPPAANEL